MAPAGPDPTASAAPLDAESREWLRTLRADGAERDAAIARLRDLLLRAARFEVGRRRGSLPHVRGDEFDDIAEEAADDALLSVLARLDDFRGASRFTTWAYKFALLEAAVKLRKRAWQGREVPIHPEAWALQRTTALDPAEPRGADRAADRDPGGDHHGADAAPARRAGLARHRRRADRRARGADASTRGALYKTLHDARRKLRSELAAAGLKLDARRKEAT